ncbi:MAG: hypothetical protein NC393_03080 [Clostridium sp.]|nr:hypothetical protein [Clostridium sp.]MCM1207872.1 hypothetical protein [Ruminococcus sp.]MCM1286728.1 hypothetical protein [Clostridium sp.]
MSKEAKELFNALVEELGRTEDRINQRMDKCIGRLEEKFDRSILNLQHEVNALKLEYTTNQVIVDEISMLKHRVDILEKKMA